MMLSEQAASDLQRTRKGSATVLHELRRYWVFRPFLIQSSAFTPSGGLTFSAG